MAIYRTYVVKSGDRLSRIADAHRTSVQALMALNGLANADKIYKDQVLKVGLASETYYLVKAGDTLTGIAGRHGVTLAAIKAANGIKNEDAIDVGQKLIIPQTATPAPPPPAAPPPPPAPPEPAPEQAPTPTDAPAPPAADPSPPPSEPTIDPPVSPITGHQLGDLSRKYEVSKGGAGTVSSGKGDMGGVSYGTYQMASKLGRPAEFLKQEGAPWAAEFGTQVQGTPAFSDTWRAIAARQPDAFQEAQHAYIARTHYGVQIAFVQAQTKKDLRQCGAAVQDVVWSCSVQHGPSSSIVVKALATVKLKIGEPGFDKELIQAVYAERGRRREDGALAYFSGNSKAVQDGVANRFRNELKDALDLLSAQTVRTAMKPVVESDEATADALVKKAAKALTDDEVRVLLERYADDEAVGDFIGGRKVAVALRKSTNTRKYRKGVYDDAILVVWREPGGAVKIKRFLGNTEPAGEYAFDGPKAKKGSSTDLNKDGRNDLGRLVPGTYHYVRQASNFNGAPYFMARDIQVTQRDTNQDGEFGPDDGLDLKGAQRTMYIHQGGNDSTWSAGCQTIPKASYGDFLKLIGKQGVLSYVLVNAD